MMTSTSDPDRSFVPFKGRDNVVLLVNNLGGLSELELGAVVAETRNALDARGFTILRVLSGSFMVGNPPTMIRVPFSDGPCRVA